MTSYSADRPDAASSHRRDAVSSEPLRSTPLETLRENADLVLSRLVLEHGKTRLLLLTPASAPPSASAVQRLEHEYSLRNHLDASWAALPLALVHDAGRPALHLDDPGGQLLSQLIGSPWKIADFLRVAIGLAESLGRLHARGLVHKDVNPANILAEPTSGRTWLTGFGIASRASRERGTFKPREVAGSLAYMAPEQTGRVNRSIDSRSDLYGYGVTLYEMLTGSLPFAGSDATEWIHCHLARQPPSPSSRAPGIPEPIAAVVLKLLHKSPEDRYQTAAGVEADLRLCLASWESQGRIDSFPLAVHDVSGRLVIPERLYGRDRQIAELVAVFDQVIEDGKPALVVVSGYAGVGKSSLVHELHGALTSKRALFASGKFDQYKRDIPYATLTQALESLVQVVLVQSEADLARWRNAFDRALGQNGQLIVDLVPELAIIIGKQPPVSELPPSDAQNRFRAALRSFLGVFASPDHPLVLFLDDLQWLDPATLTLLEDLITGDEMRHLLLVGAYRDNEVDPSHPLVRMLDEVRKSGAQLSEIALAPLPLAEVAQLVDDTLRCGPDRAHSLAAIVHEKTQGNPLFASRFVVALADEDLLVFDRSLAAWTWDLGRIRAKGYADNVVDLMLGALNRLPGATQAALGHLGCLGVGAEVHTVSSILGVSEEEVHSALSGPVSMGLVLRSGTTYRFVHDRVQEAAYSLISMEERPSYHLRIGRVLAAETVSDRLGETLFDVVSQLNRGALLITSDDERRHVAALNLQAGSRARAATAFASALTYFAFGGSLLDEECWKVQRALVFELELRRAECELLTGALPSAEARLSELSTRAHDLVERAAVASLRSTLYLNLDQSDRAMDVCLEYLRKAGVDLPRQPSDDDVRAEKDRMWSLFGSRPIEALLDLPEMTDPDWRATMDVLVQLSLPATYTNNNLLAMLLLRMTNISLEHGNCDGSCFAYSNVQLVMGERFGDFRGGFRFGKVSADLVDRGLDRFEARVFTVFSCEIVWTRHVREVSALAQRAYRAATESGDILYASFSLFSRAVALLAAGEPLESVQREAEAGVLHAKSVRFGVGGDFLNGIARLVRTLRGLTPEFTSFDDADFDEAEFERRLRADPRLFVALRACCLRKLQGRFLAHAYAAAVEIARTIQGLPALADVAIEKFEYAFYAALSHAAVCEFAPPPDQLEHRSELARHHETLRGFVETSPDNAACRLALVGAEIARLDGRPLDAEALYEEAIQSAASAGFVQVEAVANELAAHFYSVRGLRSISHACRRAARSCYERWGADGKVRQLDQLYPDLRVSPGTSRSASSLGQSLEHLDVSTVVKASQTVSSEIVLEKLVDKLMVVAIEHAGAERGLLVRITGAASFIEAEATTTGGGVSVRLLRRAPTAEDFPNSIIRYAARTLETVIVDDASVRNVFSTDEYMTRKRPRSVLCLPLVKQGQLTGILYLENGLVPYAFTPAGLGVLAALAPQAAIWLENASLHAEVHLARLRRIIDTIPTLAWSTSPDGGALFLNRQWLDFTGMTTEQARGSGWQRVVHADDAPAVMAVWGAALTSGESGQVEARMRRADGVYRWFLFRVRPLHDEHGKVVEWFGTNTDIEDRKRAEADLEWRLRFAEVSASFASAPIEQLGARIDATLHQVGEFFGVDRISIFWLPAIGTDIVPAHAWVREGAPPPPSPLPPAFLSVVASLRRGEEKHIPSVADLPDGEGSARQGLELLGVRSALFLPLIIGGETIAALNLIWVSRQVTWSSDTLKRMRLLGEVFANALARQQAALELDRAAGALDRAQRELAHITRVTTLGELAASIAHEVNQPLAAMVANAGACLNWLSRDKPDLPLVREALAALTSDGERAGQVLTRIRTLLSRSSVAVAPCDVSPVVEGVLPLLRGQLLRDGVMLETSLAPGLPCVMGDPVQLQQVVLNLVLNAAEASREVAVERRRVVVRTSVEGPKEAPSVVVSVEDAGVGLGGVEVARLFQTFYTSKPTGLGMGLSISRSIVERHGGRLWAEANAGEGATFRFALAGIP
jgi:PAS domain S-box-containing protein